MEELTYLLLGVAFAFSFISSFKFFQHWFLYGGLLVAFGGKSIFPEYDTIIRKHTNEPNVGGQPRIIPSLDSLGNLIQEDFRKKMHERYSGAKHPGAILLRSDYDV